MATDETAGLIFGRRPVLDALQGESGTVNKLWFAQGAERLDDLVALARKQQVVFQWVERNRLSRMIGNDNHQGVVARVGEVAYRTLDDLWVQGLPSPLIMLDGLTDPQNLGAVIRSADFFGAGAVLFPRWRSAGLSGSVVKASAGAALRVPLVQVGNVTETLRQLKKKGYWIYGGDERGDSGLRVEFVSPMVLVIGSEGEGLHRLVRETCDHVLAIPRRGTVPSLNASVACGVFLYLMTQGKTAS